MTTPPTSACTSHNPEMWFVPDIPDGRRDVWAAARAICNQCPVRSRCLQFALDHDEVWGMWGGLGPEERAQLVRGGAA